MKLENAIKYMNAENASNINPALLGIEVTSFPTDSREVKAGDLFFAFSQPEFSENGFNGDFLDATIFVPAAFEQGAAACVVRGDRFRAHRSELEEFEEKLIFVDDVIAAYQRLAAEVYRQWNKPVVAITGSAGKTTAKELTAHVIGSSGRRILRNVKNKNNGIGHPATVLELVDDPEYDLAVLEMGMSTPKNEIERLCRITPPEVAIELNVLPVHVEHLGSIEAVRDAKAELVEGLKPGGTAVLNADDERVLGMRELHDGRVITYGLENPADVSAENVEMKRFGETRFRLVMPEGSADVSMRLSGKHNVLNALAAAAAASCFEMSPGEIASALGTIAPPPQRGEVLNLKGGVTVINDSYNSNPEALMKMVTTLTEGAPEGTRKVVVAGEMLELGTDEKEIHRETGRRLAASGIDALIGVRGLAEEMVEAARSGGLGNSEFCEDSLAAGKRLAEIARAGDVILIKGSRGVRTERALEKLLEKHDTMEDES